MSVNLLNLPHCLTNLLLSGSLVSSLPPCNNAQTSTVYFILNFKQGKLKSDCARNEKLLAKKSKINEVEKLKVSFCKLREHPIQIWCEGLYSLLSALTQ